MTATLDVLTLSPRRTRHSRVRQQQRGKSNAAVNLLFAYHDIEVRTRNRCRAVQMSRNLVNELKAEGYSPQLIDAARSATMILSDSEDVITVYRAPVVCSLRKSSLKRRLRSHR